MEGHRAELPLPRSELLPLDPPPSSHTPSTEHGPYSKGAAHRHHERGPSTESAEREREREHRPERERVTVDLREG